MYARVARWEGDKESLDSMADGLKERSAEGPPEGVPATGFKMFRSLDEPTGGCGIDSPGLRRPHRGRDRALGRLTRSRAAPASLSAGSGRRAGISRCAPRAAPWL